MEPSELQKLANLARLEISEAALEEVASSISNVLALVDQLQAADTANVKPMAHPLDAVQRLRPDSVTETDEHEKYQAIAPATEDSLYLVPKVID